MVRWHNCHTKIREKIMTRLDEFVRRRSGILNDINKVSNNNHDNHNNWASTSPSSPDGIGTDYPPHDPFVHFDVSDDLDADKDKMPGSEDYAPGRRSPPSECQLQRIRNPICISSKSAKEMYPRLGSVSPPYLLLESLIYLMCRMHGQDDEDSDELFNHVCSELEMCGFIGASYKIDASHKIHKVFGSTFSKLILDLKCQRSPNLSPAVVKSRHYSLLNQWQIGDLLEQSRYRRSFGKKSLIARGGFGTVFRARHSLDEVDYAVKVIQFRVRSMDEYVKILREVQLYANLPAHPHVVTYKTAWLETDLDTAGTASVATIPAKNHVKIEEVTTSVTSSDPVVTDEDSVSPLPAKAGRNNSSSNSSSNGESVVFEASAGTHVQEVHLENGVNEANAETGAYSDHAYSSASTTKAVSIKSSSRCRTSSMSDSVIDYGVIRVSSSPKVEFPPSPTDISMDMKSEILRLEKIAVTLYIQMELCGINLKTWISRRNRKSQSHLLPAEEYRHCLRIFHNILTGVAFLHSSHLIHRDLKPQNILFNASEETVKIGDFGLATLHQEDVDVQHSPTKSMLPPLSVNGHTMGMGTTLYTAPEQRISGKYDAKADMYSLGIILFELLHPFNTMMEKGKCITSLKTRSSLPDDFVAAHPAAARTIIDLTSLDPGTRPTAAHVLSSDLFPSKEQQISDLQSQLQRLQEENAMLRKMLSCHRSTNGGDHLLYN